MTGASKVGKSASPEVDLTVFGRNMANYAKFYDATV